MIILALETTGSTCGACVWESGASGRGLLSLVESYVPNVHDALLASHVQQALANCSLTMNDVDVIAVSGGPGSFTGTRIGVSFAKGLCFAGSPKLIVVDTMEALASAAVEVAILAGKDICVVIPSHRSLYFTARFEVVNSTTARRSVDQHSISSLLALEEVKGYTEGSMVVGPGAIDLDASAVSGLSRLSSRFISLHVVRQLAHTQAPFSYSDPLSAEPLYRQEFG